MNQRDYAFSDSDFHQLRNLVSEHTGISLSDAKKDLVYGRLSKRVRAHSMDSFADYANFLSQNPGDELEHFTNAITTNLTSFFREAHHFDFLQRQALNEIKQRNSHSKRIRIWSAGCSTGEEPYSIAVSLLESFPDLGNWDVKILATDLDTNCVQHARDGVYTEDRVTGIDANQLRRWFEKGSGALEGKVRVHKKLRELITFKSLNLMREWPMRGPFDIVFCRNVVIYFDKPTQQILFNRMADLMPAGTLLFLGHSESLHNVTDKFELLEKTIYRRV